MIFRLLRYGSFGILGLIALSLSAQRPQERLTGYGFRPQDSTALPARSEISSKTQGALSLPFQDDFSNPGPWPQSQLWLDQEVFINRSQGRGPITLGVATFDGLNRYGRAYNLNRQATDTADHLTSRVIDLSNPQDSVYLSFFYQPGGWSEPPSSQDSLALQFWSGADSSWQSIWSALGDGIPRDSFAQVMIPVAQRFHRSDFQMRFVSYGSQAGSFDVWHLDYVELDDQRSFRDTRPSDVAFTRPHPSLLKDWESIPWFHVNQVLSPQNLAKEDIRLFYRRNVDTTASRPSLILGEFDITLNGNIVDQNGPPDANLDDAHPPLWETRFPVPDTADAGRPRLQFLNPPYPEAFTLRSRHYYSGGGQNFGPNDTVVQDQIFDNYYAFDDGSAERGYEILNNRDGFIVQRYPVIASDTLRGLYLYFMPAFYPVEDQSFSIVVLDVDNNGLPGEVIYESDSLYQPRYTEQNFYLPYVLDSTTALPELGQEVFIGIRQETASPLTLGFDQNRRNRTDAFYGQTDDFYQSFLAGTIMMRPFFRYLPEDIGFTELHPHQRRQVQVYPNPADSELHLIWPPGLHQPWRYQLLDAQGRVLLEGTQQARLEVGHLPEGLYLLRLDHPASGAHQTEKIWLR